MVLMLPVITSKMKWTSPTMITRTLTPPIPSLLSSHVDGQIRSVVHQHIWRDKCLLSQFKSFLSPFPYLASFRRTFKSGNKLSIIVDQTLERTQLLDILGSWHLNYGFQLLLGGVKSLHIQKDHTQLKETAFDFFIWRPCCSSNCSQSSTNHFLNGPFISEKKPPLSFLSIESSSRSEEGGGDQQISPKLLNTAFWMKSTQYICWEQHRKPNGTQFSMHKQGM